MIGDKRYPPSVGGSPAADMPPREETFHYPYNKKIDDIERIVNSKRINYKPSMQNTPYFILKDGSRDIGELVIDNNNENFGNYVPYGDKKYKTDPYTGWIQIEQVNNYNYWSSY